MSFEIFVFKYKIRAESRLAWLTSENAFGLFQQREPSYLLQTSFMFYFTLYFYQKHFLLHFSFSFYFFHGISQSEEKQDTGRIDIIINGDNAPNLDIILNFLFILFFFRKVTVTLVLGEDYLLRFWNKDLPRTPWSSNSLRYSSKIKFRAILDFDAHSSNGGYHKTFLTFNI